MAVDNYLNNASSVGASAPKVNSQVTSSPTSTTGTGTTAQQATQNQTGTSETNGTTSSATNSRQQNMTPEGLAALNTLIQQLMGGGTQAMADDRARKIQEIQALQGQRAGYSKDNAFGDAQGAMAQQLRAVLDKIMPNLVRASEGAGTSQNSMRALLMQQGANQAAESASSLGLKAAVDYGNISNGTSNILLQLMAQQDPAVGALIQALNISKGSITNTQSTTNGTNQSTTNTTGSTTGTTTGQTSTQTDTAPKTETTTYQPAGMSSFSGNNSSSNLGAPPSFLSTNQNLLDLLASGQSSYTRDFTF